MAAAKTLAEARIDRLVELLFASQEENAARRSVLVSYLQRHLQQSARTKRLVILRGPPGIGKTAWAQEHLSKDLRLGCGEKLAAGFAHICSAGDFMESVTDEVSPQQRLLACRLHNEARVGLCMDLKLDPIFVDNSHIVLWDMKPYAALAKKMGYSLTVVSPEEICPQWQDLDLLVSRNCSQASSSLTRQNLELMVEEFQPLSEQDPVSHVLVAAKPLWVGGGEEQLEVSEVSAAPVAVLNKLQRLLDLGQFLERFRVIESDMRRKGWRVSGQLLGEKCWFTAFSSGICLFDEYSEKMQWRTGDAEQWSPCELAWLRELQEQAFSLPLLSEVFVQTGGQHEGRSTTFPAVKSEGGAQQARHLPAKRSLAESQVPAVPTSRVERMRQKAARGPTSQDAAMAAAAGKERFKQQIVAAVARVKDEQLEAGRSVDMDECPHCGAHIEPGRIFCSVCGGARRQVPAAYKARAGDGFVKQQLAEDAAAERPQPPRGPPPGHLLAKTEEDEGQRKPLPPSRPPSWMVKKETQVKTDVKDEDVVPRPPAWPPSASRLLTIGDSDDEGPQEAASLLAAVKKGPDACISELASLVFKAHGSSAQAARQRLALVSYASRIAAEIRFPRELFILRGPPGVGKSEYALVQLQELVLVEPRDLDVARLAHVCAVDDFFKKFEEGEVKYEFLPSKLEAYHRRNESRAQLAMESGINPLFIDAPNLRLWEMKPYIELADTLGYVVKVVDPSEISGRWNDVSFLSDSTELLARTGDRKPTPRGVLQTMLESFEPLDPALDELVAIRSARQPAGQFGTRYFEEKPAAPEPEAQSQTQTQTKGSWRSKAQRPPHAPPNGGGVHAASQKAGPVGWRSNKQAGSRQWW